MTNVLSSRASSPQADESKDLRLLFFHWSRSSACTLSMMSSFPRKSQVIALCAALAALLLVSSRTPLPAQESPPASAASELAQVPSLEPSANALPLPEDRGAADLEQTLKRLGTTASVLFIVPHPDDEDGALMTYLTRGLGVRVTLLTLTRGEGGQNAVGAESYDALGLIRTSELLKADEYYGVRQLWGTEADFGFSKTQEESFQKWGHDRVLYDAVLAIRMVRPQLILSTFVGGLTDGHGQHQVAGEIAQEAFKAAADPSIFPEQLKNGMQPWQPLAVYSRTPFAPITNGQMLDYATGKWAPAQAFTTTSPASGSKVRCRPTSRFPWAHGIRCSAVPTCRLRAKAGASKSRNTAEPIRR